MEKVNHYNRTKHKDFLMGPSVNFFFDHYPKPTYDTYLQLGVKRSMVSIEILSCYQYQEKIHSNIYTQNLKGYCIRFSSHVLCTTLGKKLDIIILRGKRGKL